MHLHPEKLTAFEIAFREARLGDCLQSAPLRRGIVGPRFEGFRRYLPSVWVIIPPLVLAKALGVL